MRKNMSLSCWMIFILALVPFFISSQAIGAEPITFNYAQFVPVTHPITQQCQAWARQIEIRSAGGVKFKHFPASTLVKPQETWDSVAKGVADIGMSCFAYTAGRFPVISTLDLPHGYCNSVHAARVCMEFYKKTKPKETRDVKVLYIFGHGPGVIHTNKPVKSLSDLKGMKIRSTGMTAKIIKALGGIPVAMPQTEVYHSLKKGIVQGNITPYEPLKSMHQASVIKYSTETPAIGYTTGFYVAMNLAKWNALPGYIKRIFEEVSEEWPAMHGKTWDHYDSIARDYTLEKGNKIIKLSDEETEKWHRALKPLFQNYVKYLDGKGLAGKEILNTFQTVFKEQAGICCK